MAKKSGLPLPLLMLLVVGVPAALGAWWMFKGDDSASRRTAISEPLARRAMTVSVLESGALEALESHVIRSEVDGKAEIIYLIEEGRVLTQKDVAEGTVLVRLDDSSLKEKIDKQQIDTAAAQNGLKNALANLDIQLQQNESDKRKAALERRFAQLDLERYVGKHMSGELLDAHRTLLADGASSEGDNPLASLISSIFESEQLAGEALQKRRQLQSDIQLAIEDQGRAQVKLDWSVRLEKKGYVAKDELETDRIALERRKIELERAQTALVQYETYDFPKEVERLLSELVDSADREVRARKKAASSERKSRSDAETKKRQFELQQAKLKKYVDQLAMCVIRADRPGLVVYASSGKDRGWRDNDMIAEGTTVRKRQGIIRIPAPGSLGARVNVHESVVDKIVAGLPCKIVVDALPDRELNGEVLRRAPLPNSVNRWINPDLKVYTTIIKVSDAPPNLKPGLSCQAEIVLGDLEGVLAVPVHAVGGSVEKPAVWIWNGEQGMRSAVRLGASNDRFVEVLEGVAEGDRILLAPPRDPEPSKTGAADAETAKPEGGKRPKRGERGGR